MKTLISSLFICLSSFAIAQSGLSLSIDQAGAATQLTQAEAMDKRYTATAIGNFAVIHFTVTKTSEDATNRIKAEEIILTVDGTDYLAIGELDPKDLLYQVSYNGMSVYSQSNSSTVVFEVPANASTGELTVVDQKATIDLTKTFEVNLPTPKLKVKKVQLAEKLAEQAKSYSQELNYSVEVTTDGAFAIVHTEMTFEKEVEPRASDFSLINEKGVSIFPIGDEKDDFFRHNMNTGALRLSEGQTGEILIVFPVGKLSLKEITSDYQLSYKGLVSVKL